MSANRLPLAAALLLSTVAPGQSMRPSGGPSGGGVIISGSPAANRIAYFTGKTAITGTSGFTVNSSTGAITATTFVGNLTGNVTGAVTGNVTGNLTGNVTGNTSGTAGSVAGKSFPSVGVYASRPAAGTAGAVYIATDSPTAMWIDDGATWRPLCMDNVCKAPPLAATFTAVNQGSTTLTDNKGTLLYHMPATSGNTQTRAYVETLASSTLHVEGRFKTSVMGTSVGFPFLGGLIMRDAATGNAATLQIVNDETALAYTPSNPPLFLYFSIWSTTGAVTSSTNLRWPINSDGFFMRLRRDASNVYAETSPDNSTWTTLGTQTMAAVFGAGAPTHVGITGTSWSNVESADFLVTHYNSGT